MMVVCVVYVVYFGMMIVYRDFVLDRWVEVLARWIGSLF